MRHQFLSEAGLNKRFITDLKQILAVAPDTLVKLAFILAEIAGTKKIPPEEEEEEAIVQKMRKLLPDDEQDVFESRVRLLAFLATQVRRMPSEELTAEAMQETASGLSLAEPERGNFLSLLSQVVAQAAEIEKSARYDFFMKCGNPHLQDVFATCDLRPVFARGTSDDSEPREILTWEPVIQLEFVGELNEVIKNHHFVLTSKDLAMLMRKLKRAEQELELVRRQAQCLLALPDSKEISDER